jgi:hypothetical protein
MPFLLGGLFIGVLSALPVVGFCNCCCLWILGGGVLSAYLEQQNRSVPLTLAEGARIGFFAGVIGAVIWTVLDYALAPMQARFFGELLRNARDVPPEIQDWLEMVEEGRTGAGTVVAAVLTSIVVSIFSAIGGMIGAAYFKKDVPPALGGPINPPPIP